MVPQAPSRWKRALRPLAFLAGASVLVGMGKKDVASADVSAPAFVSPEEPLVTKQDRSSTPIAEESVFELPRPSLDDTDDPVPFDVEAIPPSELLKQQLENRIDNLVAYMESMHPDWEIGFLPPSMVTVHIEGNTFPIEIKEKSFIVSGVSQIDSAMEVLSEADLEAVLTQKRQYAELENEAWAAQLADNDLNQEVYIQTLIEGAKRRGLPVDAERLEDDIEMPMTKDDVKREEAPEEAETIEESGAAPAQEQEEVMEEELSESEETTKSTAEEE